jgi:predicted phage terminase large subunit-like protein
MMSEVTRREALEELAKRRARENLSSFVLYNHDDYIMGWFHLEICRALKQFALDVIAKKSPRLIITAPPRSGKSQLVSRDFPAWFLGNWPECHIIASSYSSDLAGAMNTDVQRIIDGPRFRELFPFVFLASKEAAAKTGDTGAYKKTTDKFEIVHYRGSYRSAGVGGGITGMGADILIIDDPHKDKAEAYSATMRSRVHDWYASTAYTRLAPGGGVIVMCTRWHPIKDDTPVLTVDGWKTHGELKPGDQVYGIDGHPVTVKAVTPPVWCDVAVDTGQEKIICSKTHLWAVKAWTGEPQEIREAGDLIGFKWVLPSVMSPVTGAIDERLAAFTLAASEDQGWGRCISTTAPDGLYLVGRTLIPTHNTDDLVGHLLEKAAHGGDQYHVINYPAIAEHDEKHRKEGEALHPERYNLLALTAIKAQIGSELWAAMYQQHPVPEGGGTFKKAWIQYYKELPPFFDKKVLSWDMTFKDSKTSDYVVGSCWGRYQGSFYLIDQVRGRWDFVETLQRFCDFARKHNGVIRKLVEEKANGAAIISALKKQVTGLIPINPTESKEARASAIATLWEAHNVYIPSPEICPWVHDFTAELLSFPAGVHDDQVDSMTQALSDLQTGGRISADNMAALRVRR